MPSWTIDFDRIFRTVPEPDRADKRAGATFVNILFGLVVTTAAIEFATEFVILWDEGWSAVSETRLAHLLLAMALTLLSWIGYHQSQQYPPFLIKFLNIPFLQFLLDVLMVIAYYAVVVVAEGSDRALRPDALPEATLVLLVFVLYALWDWLGFRLFHDPEYASRLESPRDTDETIGPRRAVTLAFTGLALLQFAAIWLIRPRAPGSVIVADGLIVAMLFLYRVGKQLSDPRVKTRAGAG